MAVLANDDNEMGTLTTSEIFLIFFVLIGFTVYNAVIFGDMTVLIGEVTKKSSGF